MINKKPFSQRVVGQDAVLDLTQHKLEKRAVNKIMERIKEGRERHGCEEQEEEQMKMKAAAAKATE